MAKIKAALCISGHFRSIDSHYEALNRYLLSNPDVDFDIFIHTWNVIDRYGGPLPLEKIHRYNPKKYIVEPPINFNITPLMIQKNFDNRDINGLLSMFYKIEQCNKLKSEFENEHKFKYDCVIRFRGDAELLESIPFVNLDFNKLYIPLHGDYGGINDQFAFSNSINMDIYSSTFHNIETYLNSNIHLNPEFFTRETIIRNNLQLVRPYIRYVIKWSNGCVFDNETRFNANIMKLHGWK
jgi:hypothetical protein